MVFVIGETLIIRITAQSAMGLLIKFELDGILTEMKKLTHVIMIGTVIALELITLTTLQRAITALITMEIGMKPQQAGCIAIV